MRVVHVTAGHSEPRDETTQLAGARSATQIHGEDTDTTFSMAFHFH